MKPEVAFGVVLKNARTNHGISQEQLALLCDLDRTFISMLERGQRQPSLTSIISISSSLQVPAHELIKQTMELIDESHEN
ncbi:helix-turn-helix domain-containing protein [Vibrio parahaemolyticus]|nr:helix-turn-helix transcriptional regulator [Vibrio parahaemolyticus]EJL7823791.1 helix-turn-helix transcriptional regulator [Vibrio parahaemolyticus]